MRNRNIGRVVALMAALGAAGTWAGETAVRLDKGVDILQQWKPDQHVYVKGDIGVADARLAELEQWIDANATNWTVLLVQSADGESYRDANGQAYRSLDAIEHAMGKGLPATTAFGALRHPGTGQASGAFFILFLQERNFSYYGSEAYERRGLGASQWAGTLDASAKRAMRNGGRVVEAAKGTITDIDGRLATALNQERRRAEEERMAAERRQEEARLQTERLKTSVDHAITAGEQEIAALDTLLAAWRDDARLAGGDLARTDTTAWKADLHSAREAWKAGQTGMADTVTKAAREAVASTTADLRRHEADAERVRQAAAQVSTAKFVPRNQFDKSPVADLRERMEVVRADHGAGNRSYRQGLEEVERGLARLQQSNQQTLRELERRKQRADHQREVRRNTILGISGGAAAVLLLGALVGNRRRRKVKAEAEALLAKRREELRDVSDRLFALMDRAALVLGSEIDLPRRGYAGETLAEARRGIAAVDEAFVISSHVHDLVSQGAALVNPGNPLSAARNFVSKGRYRRAIELLDDEVVCRPASPPPLPGSPGAKVPERPGLADGEDFALELPEWTERLEQTMRRGSEAIDTVDHAWATIVDRREALRKAVSEIQSLEARVTTPAADGWLGLSDLFSSWLPVMEETLAQAADTGKADPVAALRGPVADGDRMAAEARALVDHVRAFRDTLWTAIEDHEEQLTRRSRATAWLDQQLDALTALAGDIARAGVREPVAGRVAAFGDALQALADRVGHSARQAARADEDTLPALDDAAREVAGAREELGRSLRVPAGTILAESPERDPSRLLQEGRKQREAAQSSLDVGAPGTAAEFLDEVDRLVDEARALVAATREAFTHYDRERSDLISARDAWEQRVERTRELVASLRTGYAPAALLVDVDAGEGASFADAPQRLDEGRRAVDDLLERAAAGYATARLLAAREMLREGAQRVAAGEDLCAEVDARQEALAALEAGNTALLHERTRACEDLGPALGDRRVMQPTLTLFAEATARLAEAGSAVEATHHLNNPYHASALLEDLGRRLAVVRTEVANDLRVHQQATEMLGKVRSAEQEVRKLSNRAQADGIPDSRDTSAALDAVRNGLQALTGVAETLQQDHGDWKAVVDELGTIDAAFGEAGVTLRQELRLAQEAVETIRQAEDVVRRAGRWSGSFGVSVTGSPGRDAIIDANRAIMAGDYHGCMRHAGFAITQARQAIARAEAEEAAIRQRREAAERARRAAAQRSSMLSSSSLGSSRTSSFGSRSIGSSSSVGRSSFRSGSGVGRSGW